MTRCAAWLALLLVSTGCKDREKDSTPLSIPADASSSSLDAGADAQAFEAGTAESTRAEITPSRFREWSTIPERSANSIAAIAVGVMDAKSNSILAEQILPEKTEITIGTSSDATLRVPESYGIPSHVLIDKSGALHFEKTDHVSAYRDKRVTAITPPSPFPIRESLIVDSGKVRILIKLSSLAPDAGVPTLLPTRQPPPASSQKK